MRGLRDSYRASPVGTGQATADEEFCLVPGFVGKAPELAGDVSDLQDELGMRISVRRNGRRVGPDPDGSDRHHRNRSR